MPELESQHGGIAAEVTSSMANEFVKAVAILKGMDPITASAAGGAAGGVVKGAHAAFVGAVKRRQERVMIATEEAARVAGGHLDELLIRALDDDGRIELLIRALEAAQRTADRQRVRFYGRIAAKGVLANDTARVDEARRIFGSLAALDAVDIKVLLHMAKEGDHKWSKEDQSEGANLAKDLPEVRPVLDAVISRLESHGLVSGNAGSSFFTSAPAWWITDYGRLCVHELLEPSKDHAYETDQPG